MLKVLLLLGVFLFIVSSGIVIKDWDNEEEVVLVNDEEYYLIELNEEQQEIYDDVYSRMEKRKQEVLAEARLNGGSSAQERNGVND